MCLASLKSVSALRKQQGEESRRACGGVLAESLKVRRIDSKEKKQGRAKTSARFVDQFGKEAVVLLGVVGELLDALFFQLLDGVRDKGVQFYASPRCLKASVREALRIRVTCRNSSASVKAHR